jgi:hypothetical protein
MQPWWWIVIIAVLIVGGIILLLWSRRTQANRAQDRRVSAQRRSGAHSAEEERSQREGRRLGGMSAEDRAWEQASLGRNQAREAHVRRATDHDSSPGGR